MNQQVKVIFMGGLKKSKIKQLRRDNLLVQWLKFDYYSILYLGETFLIESKQV